MEIVFNIDDGFETESIACSGKTELEIFQKISVAIAAVSGVTLTWKVTDDIIST